MTQRARTPQEYAAGRELILEYAAALGIDLCFQNLASELDHLASVYGPPSGCLLLAPGGESVAGSDEHFVGCVGVRAFSVADCEMKRLYVRPSARQGGTGRALAAAAVTAGRELGYRRMLLDTLASMSAARALYSALGFRECAPYYDNPLSDVIYMQLEL